MDDVANSGAQEISRIFAETVSRVSDTVVELKHESAVDLELKFHALSISKKGFLVFSQTQESSIELNLATRITPQSRAVLGLRPEVVDFGEVPKNGSARKNLVITNPGTEDLQVTDIGLVQAARCKFTLLTAIPMPLLLKRGEQFSLDIKCDVQERQDDRNSGALVISSNALRTPKQISLLVNEKT
jgi:hypothetical protein